GRVWWRGCCGGGRWGGLGGGWRRPKPRPVGSAPLGRVGGAPATMGSIEARGRDVGLGSGISFTCRERAKSKEAGGNLDQTHVDGRSCGHVRGWSGASAGNDQDRRQRAAHRGGGGVRHLCDQRRA